MKQLKKLKVAGQATKCDFFIQWHLTERCNLRCRHCYQQDKAAVMELSSSEVKEVIAEVSETFKDWAETYAVEFSPSFNVTGGEPFFRKDLFEILGEIKKKGFDIYLLSNGTLIDRERAKALDDLGVRGVQVSIEGPEKVHESIRGRGSFALALKGIKCLLAAGIRVTLNVTLSRLNAGFILDLITLASSLKVQRLGFSRLVPSGRGITLLNDMLKPVEVKEIYGTLLSIKIKGLEILTGDPIASQMGASQHPASGGGICTTALGGCAAGISGLTILPDGTITPCRRLHIPIGNIRRDSLREVWATSEVLNLLRDKSKYGGKCGRCKRWANCRGCRAIAHAYSVSKGSADFLSADPQCFITA